MRVVADHVVDSLDVSALVGDRCLDGGDQGDVWLTSPMSASTRAKRSLVLETMSKMRSSLSP